MSYLVESVVWYVPGARMFYTYSSIYIYIFLASYTLAQRWQAVQSFWILELFFRLSGHSGIFMAWTWHRSNFLVPFLNVSECKLLRSGVPQKGFKNVNRINLLFQTLQCFIMRIKICRHKYRGPYFTVCFLILS